LYRRVHSKRLQDFSRSQPRDVSDRSRIDLDTRGRRNRWSIVIALRVLNLARNGRTTVLNRLSDRRQDIGRQLGAFVARGRDTTRQRGTDAEPAGGPEDESSKY